MILSVCAKEMHIIADVYGLIHSQIVHSHFQSQKNERLHEIIIKHCCTHRNNHGPSNQLLFHFIFLDNIFIMERCKLVWKKVFPLLSFSFSFFPIYSYVLSPQIYCPYSNILWRMQAGFLILLSEVLLNTTVTGYKYRHIFTVLGDK